MVLPWDTIDEPAGEKRKRPQTKQDSKEEVEIISIEDDGQETLEARRPAKKTRGKLVAGSEQLEASGEMLTQGSSSNKQQSEALSEVIASITDLCATVKELKQLVVDNPNTKLEIKRAVELLSRQASKADRKGRKLVELGVPKQPNEASRVPQSTKGTQTRSEIKIDKRAQEVQRGLKKFVETGGSLDANSEVLDMYWPEQVYEMVKSIEGGCDSIPDGEDVAVVIDLKEDRDRGLHRQIRMRNPDAANLLQGDITGGRLEYVTSCSKVTTSRQVRSKVITKHTLLLPYQGGQDGQSALKEIYNMLLEGMDARGERKAEVLNVLASESIDRKELRKVIELAGRVKGVCAKLWMPPGQGGKGSSRESEEKRKSKMGSRITVRSSGQSYAELVRIVKERVDPAELGVQIRTMRKTASGDLLVEVEGEEEKAGALKNKIEEKMSGSVVRMGRQGKTLNVLDLDPTTTMEEVKGALETGVSAQVWRKSLEVKALWESRGGNKVATIEVDKLTAAFLIREGRIRIGWVSCRVREKTELVRCYRCLTYGHRSFECKGVDRSKDCLRCAQTGHKAKDCSNEEYCGTCKLSGHRADSTSCPAHRRRLQNPEEDEICKDCHEKGHRARSGKCRVRIEKEKGGGPSKQIPQKA